jgi:hypothetical protein
MEEIPTKSEVNLSFSEGYVWDGTDRESLPLVLDAALDYRGDVTLSLGTGEEVEGYLFNKETRGGEPFVLILPSSGAPRRKIPCASIQAVAFTGKDTAAGKSWESWLKRQRGRISSTDGLERG